MTAAHESYQQLRVLKQPILAVYQGFFLMLTLMILVGATWMGLYLAKRITRPVQMLAAAADEIGAGRLDHRVKAESSDEFGSLIDAFNRMAGEVAASRRRLERSAIDLEQKHQDVEARRLRRDDSRSPWHGRGVGRRGRAGSHLERGGVESARRRRTYWGNRWRPLFGSQDLQAAGGRPRRRAAQSRRSPSAGSLDYSRGARSAPGSPATHLRRDEGASDGMVIVLDDVSPLMRAQRVAAWREVARRLAHEIKNPLTPIQLCAEHLRRHYACPRPHTGARRGMHDDDRRGGGVAQRVGR